MNSFPEARDSALAPVLTRACNALWAATLSLMAAYMHTGAPAHRYLIARNFATLREQECFAAECQASFARLARHWSEKADQLAPREQHPRGGIGALLPRLLHR